MTDDTPAMDALRYYQDKIEPQSNEELIKRNLRVQKRSRWLHRLRLIMEQRNAR